MPALPVVEKAFAIARPYLLLSGIEDVVRRVFWMRLRLDSGKYETARILKNLYVT